MQRRHAATSQICRLGFSGRDWRENAQTQITTPWWPPEVWPSPPLCLHQPYRDSSKPKSREILVKITCFIWVFLSYIKDTLEAWLTWLTDRNYPFFCTPVCAKEVVHQTIKIFFLSNNYNLSPQWQHSRLMSSTSIPSIHICIFWFYWKTYYWHFSVTDRQHTLLCHNTLQSYTSNIRSSLIHLLYIAHSRSLLPLSFTRLALVKVQRRQPGTLQERR